jgi:hypothetical protein
MRPQTYKPFYQDNGYVVIPSLFSAEEAARYLDHYMALRLQGPKPGDDIGIDIGGDDPIKRYPRMIHPHLWDEVSMRWMLDPRLNDALTALLGHEPYAVQTMVYFKPPGARGQALHQDNYYLRVQPGTCMAAWMALDYCDEANGCMQVVPGSQHWDILCTELADTNISFTDVTVPLPPGQEVRSVIMNPGDVLFFNGSIVHGSAPNTTAHRFRRALIGHYMQGDSEKISKGYQPVYRMDGTPLKLPASAGGDRCGVWVEKGGHRAIEFSGQQTATHQKHSMSKH